MAVTLPPLIVTPDELLRVVEHTNPTLAVLVEQLIKGVSPVRVPAELLNLKTD